MYKAFASGAAILALALIACAAIAGPIKDQIILPYVEIRSDKGTGSGTVIKVGDETLVLTAGHVVSDNVGSLSKSVWNVIGKVIVADDPPRPVKLYKDFGGKESLTEADIVFYSPPEEEGGHDLALLKPRNCTGLTPARVAQAGILKDMEGEDCWYIGTPMGLHQSLEKSIISIVGRKWDKNLYTVVNGCGTFGNSGGGLFIRTWNADSAEKYLLCGVVCRTANTSPKHPLMCQTPETIQEFLTHYKGSKKPGAI